MSDPYYNPEHFGLKTVGEISWHAEAYSFDLTVVWRDKSGTLYWASDSGCSCPSPFESHHLGNLETGTVYDLHEYLANRVLEYDEYDQERLTVKVVNLLEQVTK